MSARSECEQRVEELRLEMQSSCDAEKEKLQQEARDHLNTMTKQLKLQFQETQQLDQLVQQQKQHPPEQGKKELQPQSKSPPLENNYVQQHGDIQKQQEQQQQQHEGQQQQQQEKQRELQQQNQLNVHDGQKLPSGQQIEHQEQQGGLVGDRKHLRKVQGNEAYRRIGKQSSGLQPNIDRRQAQGEKPDERERVRTKDTYRVRQGEQQQGERTERDKGEEGQNVPDMQPPIRKQETNNEEQQRGSTQLSNIGERNQLEQPQRRKRLFKRSDQNPSVLAAERQRYVTALTLGCYKTYLLDLSF